jgi:hypothetical protein
MPLKGEVILDWLAQADAALHRVVIALDQYSDGSVAAWAFQPLHLDGSTYILR